MNSYQSNLGRILMRSGIFLFLIGLITGFLIPFLINHRLGLSSHLEGLLNGMFLVILGLLFNSLILSRTSLLVIFFLSQYAAYVNWGSTLLAATWGGGKTLMPLAAGSVNQALVWQEYLINFGLITLSIAMILSCLLVFWGLKIKISE